MGALVRVVLMSLVALAIAGAALSVFGIEERRGPLASEPASIDSGLFVEGVPDRKVSREVFVSAPPREVFEALTTSQGLRALFGFDANVELSLGGPYEVLLDDQAPQGQRGTEGCQVLSFVPDESLSVSWTAPRCFPVERELRTWVNFRLSPLGERTKVRITHTGFGEGGRWDEVFRDAEGLWERMAAALQRRFPQR
jgi:uncharacterized protein YndB with AHSA1/START domain